jgi:hypothetical protein
MRPDSGPPAASSTASPPPRSICKAVRARDLWAAVQPDTSSLDAPIREADRRFADADPRVQAVILAALVERYRRLPGEATIRLIVFPLVAWLYVGGAIVLAGALIALSPRRRRARPRIA